MKHLTPYAYKFTAKQLGLKETATISASEGVIIV